MAMLHIYWKLLQKESRVLMDLGTYESSFTR